MKEYPFISDSREETRKVKLHSITDTGGRCHSSLWWESAETQEENTRCCDTCNSWTRVRNTFPLKRHFFSILQVSHLFLSGSRVYFERRKLREDEERNHKSVSVVSKWRRLWLEFINYTSQKCHMCVGDCFSRHWDNCCGIDDAALGFPFFHCHSIIHES